VSRQSGALSKLAVEVRSTRSTAGACRLRSAASDVERRGNPGKLRVLGLFSGARDSQAQPLLCLFSGGSSWVSRPTKHLEGRLDKLEGGWGRGESIAVCATRAGEDLPTVFFCLRCLGGSVFGGEGSRAEENSAWSDVPRVGGALAALVAGVLLRSPTSGGSRHVMSTSTSSNGSLLKSSAALTLRLDCNGD